MLSKDQIGILLQIIRQTQFSGENVEIIFELKQTLIQMFNAQVDRGVTHYSEISSLGSSENTVTNMR